MHLPPCPAATPHTLRKPKTTISAAAHNNPPHAKPHVPLGYDPPNTPISQSALVGPPPHSRHPVLPRPSGGASSHHSGTPPDRASSLHFPRYVWVRTLVPPCRPLQASPPARRLLLVVFPPCVVSTPCPYAQLPKLPPVFNRDEVSFAFHRCPSYSILVLIVFCSSLTFQLLVPL